MRISEYMKTSSFFTDMNRTVERMVKVQSQLTSSKRIQRPSDDPGGISRLLNLKAYLSRYERYEKNVDDASQWLIDTESTLDGILDVISDINNVMLQASNDTLSDAERKILAGQMHEFLEDLVQKLNQKSGDLYLFGGTNNDTPPYTLSNEVEDETFTVIHDEAVELQNAGLTTGSVVVTTVDDLTQYTEDVDYTIDYENGTITVLASGSMADATDYLISYETERAVIPILNPEGVDGALMRKIDEGVSIQINIAADSVFSETNDLLDVVRQAITALERNDEDGIRDTRAYIEENIDAVTRVMGEVGSKIGRIELQKEKLAMNQINLEKVISSIEDADIASLVIEFQKEQLVYQAALSTAADLLQTSLLDYLQ